MNTTIPAALDDRLERQLSVRPASRATGIVSIQFDAPHCDKKYVDWHTGVGTLVHPEWLVTAAHIVTDQEGDPRAPVAERAWKARIGSCDRAEDGEVVGIADIVPHPDWRFSPKPPVRDIALMRLDRAVDQTVLKLAQRRPRTGERVTVPGWGALDVEDKIAPRQLNETTAVVMPPRVLNHPGELILATRKGHGLLHGASGSPVLTYSAGTPSVVGVLSRAGVPDAFVTDVSEHREWIRNVISHGIRP